MLSHLLPCSKFKSVAILFVLITVVTCSQPLWSLPDEAAQQFYVSPTGSEQNPGTLERPFLTLQQARDMVRRLTPAMHGDITVFLRGGTYPFSSPLSFVPADSGQNGFKVIYQAYAQEVPVISGGVPVTGWSLDHGNIYRATLQKEDKLRALFVNGVRANLTQMKLMGQGPAGEFIVSGSEPWAETPGKTFDGIKFNSADLPAHLEHPEDMEILQKKVWSFIILCARAASTEGPSTIIKIQQPYGAIAATMAFHCNLDPAKEITLCNAMEFLKEPGQFYFNRFTHTLYYFSRGEDMANAEIVAPLSEGLLSIKGTSNQHHVHDLLFQGIHFAYDHWLLKSVGESRGASGIQSLGLFTRFRQDGNHHLDHYNLEDLPLGTADLANCDHIAFVRNRFEHLASGCCVDLINDVTNCSVIGNVFQDDAGNAVNVGHPQHYEIRPTPCFTQEYVGVCAHNVVQDNWIRKVSLEFKQEEALTAFFTQDLLISHNEIEDVPYCGIALGWWWGDSNIPPSHVPKDNIIANNRVVNTQQILDADGGPIYTLGLQPGGQIKENYVNASCGRLLYPDDGSAFWVIRDNVLTGSNWKGAKWLNVWTNRCHDLTIDNNYTTTDYVNNGGTRCPVTNTHVEKDPLSPAAQAIVDRAGLEPEYKDIVPQ